MRQDTAQFVIVLYKLHDIDENNNNNHDHTTTSETNHPITTHVYRNVWYVMCKETMRHKI